VSLQNKPSSVAWISASALLLGLLWISTPGWGQQAVEPQSPSASASPSEVAPAASPKAVGGYYVEFRVAQIGTYGHSYAVYGSAGGRANYADLHPMGGYVVMALGHVLPVPANTEWDPEVLKLPISARYRRSLDAHQYQKLVAAVRTAKANKQPVWNAVSNNCNHFIGQLAQAVGLRVPGQFQVSYSFVPALRALNEKNPGRPTTAPAARSPGALSSPPS
jgi:hypothetical protein